MGVERMRADLRDVVITRAEADPGATAYEHVDPSGARTVLTRAQVLARASELARRLAGRPAGPVLVALAAGLDYPVAVVAGFLAGRPVVPAFPPGEPGTPDNGRVPGIVADACPVAAVAARPVAGVAGPTFSVPGAEADSAAPFLADRDQDVAVVQYTSGSTGSPRGVLVRHDALAANTAAIAARFGLTPDSRALTWLPPFHDMGLVGGLLTPVRAGIPVRVLAPGDFLKAPLWWLRQIGESGATASGGPDFAYALCVRRARSEAALDGLDLSGWRVAFSGGEPVRRRTLEAFAERFAPVGFRAEAFLPCYGLAEATLMVSAGHWNRSPGRTVGCGRPVADGSVAIVGGGAELARVPDGVEGEIWVAGPHVTPGHLTGSDDGMFGVLDGVRHLRTGDIGLLHGGELHVTGRTKDVLVVHGVNHHAVDVEAAAVQAAGRPARTAAAFLVEPDDGAPLPVVVVELAGRRSAEAATGIRAAVLAATGLRPAAVVLVAPRTVPRTSSGKVRRTACRAAYLADGLGDTVVAGDGAGLAGLDRARRAATDAAAGTDAATDELAVLVAGVLAAVVEAPDCGPDSALVDLAVDSVAAGESAAVLEDALGLPVALAALLRAATPREVAAGLVTGWAAAGHGGAEVRDRMARLQTAVPALAGTESG